MRSQLILRSFLVIVLASALGLLTRSLVERDNAPAPVAETIPKARVRVAVVDLPRGTLIQSSDLGWAEIDGKPSRDQISENDGDGFLLGAVVRTPMPKDEPILKSRVVPPNAPGFLAEALAPGMRAFTVGVNEVTGHSGLLRPGDHVDVLLTHQPDNGTKRDIVGETILTDVRVIAVGAQIADAKQNGENKPAPRTVTLEVTPDQAQKVAVTTRLGEVVLTVRSLASEFGGVRQTDGAVPPQIQAPDNGRAVMRATDVSKALAPAPRKDGTDAGQVNFYRGSTKSH